MAVQTFAQGLKHCGELNGTTFYMQTRDRVINLEDYHRSLDNLASQGVFNPETKRPWNQQDADARWEVIKKERPRTRRHARWWRACPICRRSSTICSGRRPRRKAPLRQSANKSIASPAHDKFPHRLAGHRTSGASQWIGLIDGNGFAPSSPDRAASIRVRSMTRFRRASPRISASRPACSRAPSRRSRCSARPTSSCSL